MTTSSLPQKRFVFVTGDKGGVGKSFLSRALVQFYLDRAIPFRAYDIDPVNPSLEQFYPNVTTSLNIGEPGSLDQLRNDLDKHHLLIVDCAARSLDELDRWFTEMNLFQQRKSLHFAVTFVFAITPDKSCTAIMTDALARFGSEAAYVVAKNLGKGADFSIYDDSKLREELLSKVGGKEITLPKLLERTVVRLDSDDISFGEALRHSEVTSADRSRVMGFLGKFYEELEAVKSWLVPQAETI